VVFVAPNVFGCGEPLWLFQLQHIVDRTVSWPPQICSWLWVSMGTRTTFSHQGCFFCGHLSTRNTSSSAQIILLPPPSVHRSTWHSQCFDGGDNIIVSTAILSSWDSEIFELIVVTCSHDAFNIPCSCVGSVVPRVYLYTDWQVSNAIMESRVHGNLRYPWMFDGLLASREVLLQRTLLQVPGCPMQQSSMLCDKRPENVVSTFGSCAVAAGVQGFDQSSDSR